MKTLVNIFVNAIFFINCIKLLPHMKKLLKFFGLALLLFVVYFGFTTYPKLDLISGFASKNVASAHFIDHRNLKLIEQTDNDMSMIDLAKNEINNVEKSASASVYGLKTRKAIYREGLGATLINEDFDVLKPYLTPKRTKVNTNLPFPYGDLEQKDTVFSNIDYVKLKKAVDNAFDENGAKNKKTRSVLVIYKDKIIAEKYDQNFNKNSRILGWSMTKSITQAMFGILQKQKKIDIYRPAPIAEWKNDDRKNITINDLLHMNSGLEWEENYTKICDATQMLFQATDMTKCQILKPAQFKPNSHWNYSSGTSNLLSGILRNQFKTHQEYLDFWYAELIDKIGMHSMVIETDMAGNFVGSSYGWATTRDWAKFGLLYLHNGNWNGTQILDKSWVDYTRIPAKNSKGIYGAHFWLNAGGRFPDAPRDLYSCDGFQGQKVFIIPSLDIIIVRMGLKGQEDGFDFNGFLKGILGSIGK